MVVTAHRTGFADTSTGHGPSEPVGFENYRETPTRRRARKCARNFHKLTWCSDFTWVEWLEKKKPNFTCSKSFVKYSRFL